MKMKPLTISVFTAAVSLAVAAAAHRYCPAFAVTFKPLLWPLLPLVFAVRPGYAAAVALTVPFLSAAVNSMPTYQVAAALSLSGLLFVALASLVKASFRRMAARNIA